MAEHHIKEILERLLELTRKGGQDVAEDVTAQAPGPPASRKQLAALERHWGCRLPPSYREVLESYNGMPRLWFDVRLLSIQEIIEGAPEVRALEGPRSGLRKWIFARGTESEDALAFDPSQVGDDGEMPVIRVSEEEGGRQRWSSLRELLDGLSTRLFFAVRQRGDTSYYLWTSLWTSWPDGTSRHSRIFIPGNGGAYAVQKELFDRVREAPSNPLLPEAQQEQVDLRFEQAVMGLEGAKGKLAIVLTDAPAMDAAHYYYIYYEPCADLVIALNPLEKHTVIYADSGDSQALNPEIMSALEKSDELLRQGRIVDALLLSIDEACGMLRLLQERFRR